MVPVALSDVIAVGEVPTADEVAILAKAGFRALLDTQPDGEVARLMPAADVKAMAEAAGLVFLHLPITSRRPDDATLTAFAKALADMPRPIYACCYSGARTAAAWALAAAAHDTPDAIIASCSAAGYDIEFLRDRLIERRRAATADRVATLAVATVTATPSQPPVLPKLTPSVLIPRAASAGGFAVAG